ncbi:glycosyl hydrolase 43 family, partial [Rhizoctonia solani]
MRAAFLLPALLASFAVARPLANPNATRYDAIIPGADWRDTDGVLIQAHGGAMVRTDDGTFYWFGEDHRPGGTHFTGIAVYSSKDLYNWKNEGLAFKPVEGTPAASDQVGERPKVVYSEKTKQWVLYFHSDNPSYSLHYQAIGLSPNVTGPYVYQDSYLPFGLPSQDLGMYVDDDNIAYALYGSRGNNAITRLRDDRLNVSEIIYSFSGTNLEAPGMFKENGTYYHIFSQKTGYRPNNAQLFTAPALTGPWTRQPQLAPEGTNTWESQNTFELKIKGTKKTTHIFMGDRWDRDELSDSRYMWLPITIGGKQAASLEWHDIWKIDVNTGEVTYPKGISYEAEKGVITGGANVTSCSTCSGGNYVTGITSNSSVTITNIQGTGKPQWLAIYYVNTDVQTTALHRYAGVSVNGAAPEVVKQRTTAEGVVVSVPLQVQFAKGSKNNVTISGVTGRQEHASAMVNQNEIVTTPASL